MNISKGKVSVNVNRHISKRKGMLVWILVEVLKMLAET